MAILKPSNTTKMENISTKFPKHIKDEMIAYCKFAHIEHIQDFLTQAVEYIFSKDKEWLKYKKDNIIN